MTIYVSELPKSCEECFCNVEDTWCALSDGEMGDICEECDNKTRHKKCPIQSLAEHDKQVRKEVLGDLKEELKKNGKCSIRGNGTMDFFIEMNKLNQILEQLQGE